MKQTGITASGLKYAEICPGFSNDIDGDTVAADEGKLLHKACETGDLTGLTDEQKEQVEKCLGFIAPMVVGADRDLREQEMRVPIINRRGIVDRLIIKNRTAYAIDWKFGRNPVDDAEINNQGQAYALALLKGMPDI